MNEKAKNMKRRERIVSGIITWGTAMQCNACNEHAKSRSEERGIAKRITWGNAMIEHAKVMKR